MYIHTQCVQKVCADSHENSRLDLKFGAYATNCLETGLISSMFLLLTPLFKVVRYTL